LKRAERESFLKSFGVFFTALALLSALLAYLGYYKLKHELQEKLYNEMRLCSYDLQCTRFDFDFVPLESKKLYQLNESQGGLYALFSIPKNETYALKLTLPQHRYHALLDQFKTEVFRYYLLALLVIALVSALFSFYALHPLRRALRLTEEFSRDILHDLGTPLSALRLNVSRLRVTPGDERKIERITQSIETILSLGENLRGHLEEHEHQREIVELHLLIHERLEMLRKLYPDIRFSQNNGSLRLRTNRDALARIIDNLLTNAAKYNLPNGSVKVDIDASANTLRFTDTGKGIQNPDKIFDRFYKEQDRGMGIGLHIVKKLCDVLHIPIRVSSRVGEGSVFTLDLGALTLR
jgi:signal transduction histidine kinase